GGSARAGGGGIEQHVLPDADQLVAPAQRAGSPARPGDEPLLVVLEPAAARWVAGGCDGRGGGCTLRDPRRRRHRDDERAAATPLAAAAKTRLNIRRGGRAVHESDQSVNWAARHFS